MYILEELQGYIFLRYFTLAGGMHHHCETPPWVFESPACRFAPDAMSMVSDYGMHRHAYTPPILCACLPCCVILVPDPYDRDRDGCPLYLDQLTDQPLV